MPQNIPLITFRSDSHMSEALIQNGEHENSLSSTVPVASSTAGQELSNDEQKSPEAKDGLKPRGQWASRYEFVLSHLGFCIGLGNVWRFPYICYKNGGGAFFIPYIICLCCAGIPVAFLEVALGQYFATGGISCWDICPLFRGVGYASTVILFWLNVYYIVVLAWGALYLFYCFCYIGYDLPWTTCNNDWNTPQCYANFSTDPHARFFSAPSGGGPNRSVLQHAPVDPATEFWEHKILNISDGIDNIGSLNGHLSLSLLIVWIVCFFCVWKGVRTAGKVVYVTAIFPYGMLALLVVRGMTLPGAFDGIYYYMKPDLSRLGDSSVWVDAGTQVFFSLTVGLSSLTALSSYNSFDYNCYKHTLYLCTVDVLTSFFAGFAVFSVLGFMAEQLRVPIETVAESGPGLAFVVYPTAMAQMPGGIAWAIFFFIMLILLGLDTQFVGIDGFVSAIVDIYPKVFRKGYRREILIGCLCLLWYVMGLWTITEGGMYVFQLFDHYCTSSFSLLWIAFWECIVVGWFYGADRFYDNIQLMVGERPSPWMKWSWQYAGPTFTLVIFCYNIIQYEPLVYDRIYEYPLGAQVFGWLLALSSMLCIPGYMIYKLVKTPGLFKQRWRSSLMCILPDRPEAKIAKQNCTEELLFINGDRRQFL